MKHLNLTLLAAIMSFTACSPSDETLRLTEITSTQTTNLRQSLSKLDTNDRTVAEMRASAIAIFRNAVEGDHANHDAEEAARTAAGDGTAKTLKQLKTIAGLMERARAADAQKSRTEAAQQIKSLSLPKSQNKELAEVVATLAKLNKTASQREKAEAAASAGTAVETKAALAADEAARVAKSLQRGIASSNRR